jgi:aspartyl-tRNA(Asn)/glutamyl-tRNA(Gln) amidotransferase subunit B
MQTQIMSVQQGLYETIIGLEVHAQLLTRSKLFSADSTAFGAEPNTEISAVTLGYPGTLPVLNKKAVELAIRMGIACHCEIEKLNYFARKNYFYPDLPKGYQISQHTSPICKGGFVNIRTSAGSKKIQLNRIHLEEDAGKSIHDADPVNTSIDFNRAGVPLIEIVTEPVLRSAEEAYVYLTELRKILRYLGVCDGNMEEGSMRCDANISIRKKGEKKLGTKVEVKNLNSIRNVKRAIEFEVSRMTDLVEAGMAIEQQTRSFDADSGTTFALRTKEEANDYRYFPDPDLPPFEVSDDFLHAIKKDIPQLPEELIEKYTRQLSLPEYDARVITDDKEMADYFELLANETNPKSASNWLLGPVKSYLNVHNLGMRQFPIEVGRLASLITLVDSGKMNFSMASSRLFPELIRQPNADAEMLAESLNLIQNADGNEVEAWVQEVLERMPEKVLEYRKGKKGLIGLFVGEVKKLSKGKADPKLTNKLLLEKLEAGSKV